MSETTQEERDYLRDYVNDIEGDDDERAWLLVCIDDSDRLAQIERHIHAFADQFEREAMALHDDGFEASAAIRQRDARELRAIIYTEIDTGEKS